MTAPDECAASGYGSFGMQSDDIQTELSAEAFTWAGGLHGMHDSSPFYEADNSWRQHQQHDEIHIASELQQPGLEFPESSPEASSSGMPPGAWFASGPSVPNQWQAPGAGFVPVVPSSIWMASGPQWAPSVEYPCEDAEHFCKVCWNFAKGKCDLGEQCPCCHDPRHRTTWKNARKFRQMERMRKYKQSSR
jgi:hypothetical protein